MVVVVLRSPIHANEPSEYNGMLYRTSNRVLNNGIKVIILICMDGTSQYHHHPFYLSVKRDIIFLVLSQQMHQFDAQCELHVKLTWHNTYRKKKAILTAYLKWRVISADV